MEETEHISNSQNEYLKYPPKARYVQMTVYSQSFQIGNHFGVLVHIQTRPGNLEHAKPLYVWLHDYVQAWSPIIMEA